MRVKYHDCEQENSANTIPNTQLSSLNLIHL